MMLVEWNLHGIPFRQPPLSCMKRTFSSDWKDVTFWCHIVLMEDIKTQVEFENIWSGQMSPQIGIGMQDMKLYNLPKESQLFKSNQFNLLKIRNSLPPNMNGFIKKSNGQSISRSRNSIRNDNFNDH